MRRQQKLIVVVAAWILAVAPALGQTPQDALRAVPEKAAGFVIVNNIGEVSSKIESLARRVGAPLPSSPLEMVKSELGLSTGINNKGSLLMAFILDEGNLLQPAKLVYVPVTDYAVFLKSLSAQADGGIAEVKLSKGTKPMLVGRHGSFAVLAEPSDKDALQEALRSTLATNESVGSRLPRNDITGVLTTRGIKLIASQARPLVAMAKNGFPLPPEQQFLLAYVDALDRFLQSVESDVTHVLLGSRVDQAGNLDVNATALFAAGSGFAQAGAKAGSAQVEPLAGLPDVPYAFAFSGSTTGGFMRSIMDLGSKLVTMMAKDVPADKVKKMEQAVDNILMDLHSMSMVMGPGTGKETLFQNTYAILKVADAEAYLRYSENYLEAYESLMKEVKLPEGFPKQSMKATKTKINGLPALEIAVDMGMGGEKKELDAQKRAEEELVKKMMEVYFGPSGKMFVTTVAVDKNTVLMRYTPPVKMKEFIKTFKEGTGGLAKSAAIVQTTKLLPEGSQWYIFISPRGTVSFVHRVMTAMMPQAGGMGLPDFPQTPPIAVGVKLSATALEKRAVIPAAAVDGIGAFVRQVHEAKGAAGGAP